MDKELKEQVKSLVDEMFGEKEEADIRRRTEDELEKAASSISELTEALESKNSEFAEMGEKIVASEQHIQELTSELEAAREETRIVEEKATELKKELEGLVKERAAEKRMAELEDAGVARSDKQTQMAKIMDMLDEEFASYKDELVAIRESVVKELEQAAKQLADANVVVASAEDVQEEAEEVKEVATEEEEVVTPPVQITPGQAAMASLNMEFIPKEDVRSKYAELGKAMASKFKKS